MCREVKPVSEFNKTNSKHPSHRYCRYCRECQKFAYSEWVAKNKERKLKAVKEYQRANVSWIAIQDKRRYDNGGKERQQAHISANRDQYNSYNNAARARKKNAEGAYTAEDVQRMLLAQSGLCNGCGKPMMPYCVDHIIPLNDHGTNWPDNLQLLCRSCNCKKSDLDWEEFLSRLSAEKILLDATHELCV
jgi:5-methylcytosine-specific restriction endonuclease McrA